MIDEELGKIRGLVGDQAYEGGAVKGGPGGIRPSSYFPEDVVEFRTLPAYRLLDLPAAGAGQAGRREARE